jgi:hypothetical protein
MNNTEISHNYHIFRCCSYGCHEIIPVESFFSLSIPPLRMSYLQDEKAQLNYDLHAIDVTCPYCSRTNHFQIKDRIRPISRQEYKDLSHAVESRCFLMRDTNKILLSNKQTDRTS